LATKQDQEGWEDGENSESGTASDKLETSDDSRLTLERYISPDRQVGIGASALEEKIQHQSMVLGPSDQKVIARENVVKQGVRSTSRRKRVRKKEVISPPKGLRELAQKAKQRAEFRLRSPPKEKEEDRSPEGQIARGGKEVKASAKPRIVWKERSATWGSKEESSSGEAQGTSVAPFITTFQKTGKLGSCRCSPIWRRKNSGIGSRL